MTADTVTLNGGGQLVIRIDGPDRAPWVVFSNSVLTDLSIWDAPAAALSDRYRVLRYDQRGHGGSSLPGGAMSFEDYGADLCAVLDACGVDRCVFVGLSMGTPTGLAALATRPDVFAGFVAVDGVSRSAPGREAFWGERRDTARAEGMDVIAAQTAGKWLPGAAPEDEVTQTLTRMIAATPVEGFAAATHALASYDLSAGLGRIPCPVLGIYGEQDGAMPDAMRAQFGTAPDARFIGIPGAGHVPPLQDPAAFIAALTPFLGQVLPTEQETRP